MTWSQRRKVLYVTVAGLCVLALLFVLWRAFFTVEPLCTDGIQNGNETGVDCGGSCALICAGVAHAPVVLWSRAFPNGTNTYTAAAYVQNNNLNAGARQARYSFQLFDADNQLIVERDGQIDLPPTQIIPIIEPTVDVGNRTVAHALFAFSSPPVWSKIPAGTIPPVKVSGQVLSPDGSRLSATVANDTVSDIANLTVAAVLFDAQGVARAASKSVLPSLPHKSSQEVVFTWPNGTPNIVRAEITVLPSF